MGDWPPMNPVRQQHEKENTYLTLVDMFVDVVEPSIIQMILQEKNWNLDAALEDIMILASASHVDKSRQKTNESFSSLGAKKSYSHPNQRKSNNNRDGSSPVNSVNSPIEQLNSYDKTPFNSGKKNSKLHTTNASSGLKDLSNTKPISLLPFLEQYNYIKSIPVSYDRAVMLMRDGVKVMVILRGPPGSGKSHLARKLLNDAGVILPQHKRHIFSTDDFFVQNNVYLFVPELLGQAHMWNQRNVATAIREQVSPIVVDNTNTQAWEIRVYVEMAVSGGYDIEILEPDTWWIFREGELAKKNIHGVPKATIRNMIERYDKGLTPEMLMQKFNLRYSLSSAPPQPVHKSKWKDKLSNQTNNKPKKKKNDSITKTNSLDNCIHDSFTTFPSNSVGVSPAPNFQYPLNSSKKEMNVSLHAKDGKAIYLESFNQSTSNHSSKQTNYQNFFGNSDSKLHLNASNPFLDFECNSTPVLQNSNPFLENYTSKRNGYDLKTISQPDIERHGYEHLKSDSSKNTFDFMAETKKMLASLGNSQTCRNKELESTSQGEANAITELLHSKVSIEDGSNEDSDNTQINKETCISECYYVHGSKGNETNDDIKSIASEVIDLVIQNVVREPKDKSTTSPLEGSEDKWEYVLVNDDGTYTYKRANADLLTLNFSDQQTYTEPNSKFFSVDGNASISNYNNDQYLFQNTASNNPEISISNSLLNDSGSSSEICQKEVLEDNLLKNNCTMFQNCAVNSTKDKNSDHITSNNTDTFGYNKNNYYKMNTEDSQQGCTLFTEKSVDGFQFCDDSTSSKQTGTINGFSKIKEHLTEQIQLNKELLEVNCTQSELLIPDKSIYNVTSKESNETLNCKEMLYDGNYLNHLHLSKELLREEVCKNCFKSNVYESNFTNSDSSIHTKVLSLFGEKALAKSDHQCTKQEEDSSTNSYDSTVCEKDQKHEELITNLDHPNEFSKGYDKEGQEMRESSEKESKICEDFSYGKEIIDGKSNNDSSNEKCAVVLEMMKDILKSMTPLNNNSLAIITKDFNIQKDMEMKELESSESGTDTRNVSSTVIISDWESGECWLPENKDSSNTEVRQPKPARNTSRPKVQSFFPSTFQFEPKEIPSSLNMWDTVSYPLEHWDTLKNDCVFVKEKPAVLPQRVKLSNKNLTNSSTNTNYQDFSLIKEEETPGTKIIIGISRNITEGFCDLKSDTSEVSETLYLDKSTMTNGNFLGPVKYYDIAQVSNLFPNIPKKYIFDMVEKCHGDINWAVDLLLDSEHSIYEKLDVYDDEETNAGSIHDEEVRNESKQNLCTYVKVDDSHLVPEDFKVLNESTNANVYEQSIIKQMIENSVVIGKEHYSEKVLKVLKKKRPEYLSLIESSHSQINKQLDVVESILPDNVCNTKKTGVDDEMSDEVSSCSCDTENDDDNYFEVVVNNDLILQLQQKFGNSNFPKLTNMTPVVKLPLSLARQLYGYIMDTLQTDLDEKQEVIENMICQDEEIARLLQSQDENLKPQLQEIMDMEVALEVHRADQEELKERSKSTVAATLSKNILLEKFPQVDPKMLMEVFQAHNLSLHDTVAFLQLALGVKAAQLPQVPVSTNSQDQTKVDVTSGFSEDVDLSEEAQAHREQAASYYSLRMECLNKAHDAFRSGNKPVATYYSHLAQMHKDKIAHCNSQAAACLMSSHIRGNNTLDLHFLHVTEAQVVLDMFLDETITNINEKKKKHQTVYLITGRGLRSVGGVSRIKPMVLKTLNAREILFNDVNPGMLSASLRATTPLSHSL